MARDEPSAKVLGVDLNRRYHVQRRSERRCSCLSLLLTCVCVYLCVWLLQEQKNLL